jgi:hypothetical protein
MSDAEDGGERASKRQRVIGPPAEIAVPMAGKKLHKRVYKVVKKGACAAAEPFSTAIPMALPCVAVSWSIGHTGHEIECTLAARCQIGCSSSAPHSAASCSIRAARGHSILQPPATSCCGEV